MNDEIRVTKTSSGFIKVDVPPSSEDSHWAIFFKEKEGNLEYAGFSYTYDDNPKRLEPPKEVIAMAQKIAEEYVLRQHQPRLPFP